MEKEIKEIEETIRDAKRVIYELPGKADTKLADALWKLDDLKEKANQALGDAYDRGRTYG